MRSLLLLDAAVHHLVDGTPSSHKLSALTTDPSTNALYAIAELDSPDGLAHLAVYAIAKEELGGEGTTPIIEWSTESAVSEFAAEGTTAKAVVSFKYLPESDSLAVVLANGDIEQIFSPGSTDAADVRRENVGCVDAGMKAAAWSPDEELLALVTGDDKLIVMTKEFEVLSEGPLRTSEFGEDAPVNVGWGDKTTQFHGSVGKAAAAAAGPSSSSLKPSPDDDSIPRISWRGDSAFFTVSSLEPVANLPNLHRRTIRVFSRLAVLSSTSEPTNGLEHTVAWQPSGSIIAATQKVVDEESGEVASHHVIFFERNGLRRYEFALREVDRKESRVEELAWNTDSTLLAVWIKRKGVDVVQLWHRNNYYWYLKQEIAPRLSGSAPITSLLWHPENGLDLYLSTTTGVESFHCAWDVFSSPRAPPRDDGGVAVVDGSNLKLTPFRFVNIPPPMSATTLQSSRSGTVPIGVAFSATSSTIATLYNDGFVEVWGWELPKVVKGKAREDIKSPTLLWTARTLEGVQAGFGRQVACIGDGEQTTVAVLASTRTGSALLLSGKDGETRRIDVAKGARRLVAGAESFLLETGDGVILEVSTTAEDGDFAMPSEELDGLPEFCSWIRHIQLSSSAVIVGLSESGRLYAGSRLLANNATSLTSTPDFLIFTTFTHEVKFIPLFSLDPSHEDVFVSHVESFRKQARETQETSIKRAVERGSRIVTVVPSATSLVLQMPRGNLETICPRPLVLQIVRQDLNNHRFRAAFLACRKHRIDLNLLHDHDPQSFLSHLSEFVDQVKDVDYLNLFLSGLKNVDVTTTMYRPLIDTGRKPPDTSEKVNKVCDLLRAELEKRDTFHYANSVLTAYVRKQPPDYESALKVLADLKAQDAARAEDAVKYIIFLSDANKLFDLALGMYDFSLVIMVAQHSQKDPREYLPFLRELRQLDTYLQRFRIDDHLERHESALRNLAQAGPEHFEQALGYTKEHSLYSTALAAFRDDSVKYKTILIANAEYLMEQRHYAEAGLMFAMGSQPASAVTAYQKANAWRELFNLLLIERRPAAEIKALAVEAAEQLKGKSRWAEAGQVLLEYGRDVEAAVAVLVEGNVFAEALRLTSLYSKRELIETHIKPGTLETQGRFVDDITEVREQVEKQVERLAELEEKKESNPAQYFCVEGNPLDNVELQPDGASDAGTAFTRYTAVPTTVATSQMSSRSTRSKRRGGIKRAAGKKGTIFEEFYLLRSLKKTVEDKLGELQTEVKALLPILLTLNSSAHRSAAAELQQELDAFESCLRKAMDTIWKPREREWAEEKVEEMKAREMGEWVEKPPPAEGLERVERPKLAKTSWRLGVLDALKAGKQEHTTTTTADPVAALEETLKRVAVVRGRIAYLEERQLLEVRMPTFGHESCGWVTGNHCWNEVVKVANAFAADGDGEEWVHERLAAAGSPRHTCYSKATGQLVTKESDWCCRDIRKRNGAPQVVVEVGASEEPARLVVDKDIWLDGFDGIKQPPTPDGKPTITFNFYSAYGVCDVTVPRLGVQPHQHRRVSHRVSETEDSSEHVVSFDQDAIPEEVGDEAITLSAKFFTRMGKKVLFAWEESKADKADK
ncbi:elongator complex protein 1 [Pseudohyphozyma bogoriensis]|nr:elongator complex protein 1 [Pseudohyphozyma bogoriensis]